MKILALRTLIKEAIDNMELSLELSNGKIIHGLARKRPKALSLQIGNNNYFSFWEGKFSSGGVKIVGGVDDRSQEWFLKATEEYLVAMHDAYPERFGPLKEVSRPTQDQVDRFFTLTQNNNMKTPTLRQIIKEEIAQSSASELLSMLAHPDFKKQLSILNNDSVNNAYENLYATLMGIERNEPLNENKSRTVIINSTEEWEDLANNLKGYKYSGSLKPVSANRGLIQLSNYAKYPYEVIIDDKNKMIQFGEHSLK